MALLSGEKDVVSVCCACSAVPVARKAANIIIVFIATLMTNNLVKYWTIIFNVCMIALNIIPIFQNNDGKMIINCCKEYK